MDPSTVATFELHLTIQVLYHSFSSDLKFSQASMAVTTRVRQTLTNIVRKIGGKPTQVSSFTHPVFSLSLPISGSYWPQVQADQEEALQVLDFKLGEREI